MYRYIFVYRSTCIYTDSTQIEYQTFYEYKNKYEAWNMIKLEGNELLYSIKIIPK